MTKKLHLKTGMVSLAMSAVIWISSPSGAPAQDNPPSRSNDIARGELASFDQFLDNHREIAEQLRANPSLVNDSKFVKDHSALQTYLQDHPAIREEISENPKLFMNRENRFDRREDAFDHAAGRREADERQPDLDNRPNSDRRDADERRADNHQATQTRDDLDTTRGELAGFDRFLDSHRDTAEQLRKDPSLVNNQQYLQNHPDLQAYLQNHPTVREEITENPHSFMRSENRYDARERYINRSELARLDMFLDSHPRIAEELRKDPSLVRNQQFVQNHPDLQTFLHDRPDLASQWTQHPEAFMQREARYEATENPAIDRPDNRPPVPDDHDTTRGQLASFDRFLDSHHETAEQLRRDPSLVNNKQFVQDHPALQAYLQEHQGVREKITEDPNAFMRQEDSYDRREDMDRSHTQQAANFRDFLNGHSGISQDLSRNPMKANDPDYQRNHPELRAYLSAHPDVQSALTENPQSVMKTVQQPATSAPPTAGTTGATKPATPPASKPPTR